MANMTKFYLLREHLLQRVINLREEFVHLHGDCARHILDTLN